VKCKLYTLVLLEPVIQLLMNMKLTIKREVIMFVM